MAFGLAALLDDVAALAKLAAASLDDIAAGTVKASAKAAAVVVDDTAVTPQYVRGVDPSREIPIIAKIARGSLINKAIILVLALTLSQIAPWILTPLLMLGGAYLCFEGAEKIWGKLLGHQKETQAAVVAGEEAEKRVVSTAVRTDFILSAEIMVISLNEVTDRPFVQRAFILAAVALFITAIVYGLVAALVKIDDLGVSLAARKRESTQKLGRSLVAAMPHVLSVITIIGVAAMLWVGGHLLINGMAELGFALPHDLIHHLVAAVPAGTLAWIAETVCSLVAGFILGSLIVALEKAVEAIRHH